MKTADPQQCDISELAAMLAREQKPVLLDVREKWEVDLCRLPEALHIPLAELSLRAGEIPPDRDIIVYCHHGVRSLQGAAMLRLQGIPRAVSLRGGIHAWAEKIDPAMAKY